MVNRGRESFTHQLANDTVEDICQSWAESYDDSMSSGYRVLFMLQEAVIRDAMQDHQEGEDER